MKVTKHKNGRIDITPQNVEESRALYAIFNHTDNQDLLGEKSANKMMRAIGHKHWVTSGEIARGITHDKYYAAKS